MNILIISGDFYPNNSPRAFRTTELAKRFCILGHEVTVYIPHNGVNIKDFIEQYPITVRYYHETKGKTFLKAGSVPDRLAKRLLAQFFEYPYSKLLSTIPKAVKNESGYDLLITIAMPHPIHWAVGKMCAKGKRLAKTWVADCGDPYMFCGTSQYKHPFYFAKQEKRWCRECDYIAVPVESALSAYYPEFKSKIRIIPQAFDFSEVKLQEYVPNHIPTFAFSGNLIPNVRDPKPLLDYLCEVNKDFKFIVYTTKQHLVNPYKAVLGDKLEVHGYIPRLELLEKLSGMDFLINIGNVSKNQLPSKLIDYGLTKRPILNINPQSFDPTLIDDFLKRDYSRQYVVDSIERYNIVTVAQQFLDLCD